MPLINLTKKCTIATEAVERVRLTEDKGKTMVKVFYKQREYPSLFSEEEAEEAWAIWQDFMKQYEEISRKTVGHEQ
ncbi:MAG: hypothetical protein ABSH50_25680 [Bryobacteraceae bacterium]|jgi:uridine phosphorylase